MTYTTISGDCWDWIAYKALGSCRHTEKLINANRDFADIVIFSAGTILELPDVSTERRNFLPPWKTENLS